MECGHFLNKELADHTQTYTHTEKSQTDAGTLPKNASLRSPVSSF